MALGAQNGEGSPTEGRSLCSTPLSLYENSPHGPQSQAQEQPNKSARTPSFGASRALGRGIGEGARAGIVRSVEGEQGAFLIAWSGRLFGEDGRGREEGFLAVGEADGAGGTAVEGVLRVQ